MCFKQDRTVFSLSNKPLKLEDQLSFLGRNISSTQSNISIRIGKTWAAIVRLSIIQKSDLSDELKQNLFQAV